MSAHGRDAFSVGRCNVTAIHYFDRLFFCKLFYLPIPLIFYKIHCQDAATHKIHAEQHGICHLICADKLRERCWTIAPVMRCERHVCENDRLLPRAAHGCNKLRVNLRQTQLLGNIRPDSAGRRARVDNGVDGYSRVPDRSRHI